MGNSGLGTSTSYELITNQKTRETKSCLSTLEGNVGIQRKFMQPTRRLSLCPVVETPDMEATSYSQTPFTIQEVTPRSW